MNFYNYFIYPYRYHTCKTNAVLLTSLKKCQQHCIGKCRCYDLYTTPICNAKCKSYERRCNEAKRDIILCKVGQEFILLLTKLDFAVHKNTLHAKFKMGFHLMKPCFYKSYL